MGAPQIIGMRIFYLNEKRMKIGQRKKKNLWRQIFAAVENATLKSGKNLNADICNYMFKYSLA